MPQRKHRLWEISCAGENLSRPVKPPRPGGFLLNLRSFACRNGFNRSRQLSVRRARPPAFLKKMIAKNLSPARIVAVFPVGANSCQPRYSGSWVRSQSIGLMPCADKKALVLEKCRQPKNPAEAERGLGCAHSRTRFLFVSISAFFFLAGEPQSKNTAGFSRAERRFMIASVNSSQW